eukprot:517100-Prorocentrum_minimum.AAC.1
MAYVSRIPEGEDINNAELITGLLQAVQDEASPGDAAHIHRQPPRRLCGGPLAGGEGCAWS